MKEVFEKKVITSRDFPVILFAARGVLLHYQPTLERFFQEHLRARGYHFTEEQLLSAQQKVAEELIEASEKDESLQMDDLFQMQKLCGVLGISSDEIDFSEVRSSLSSLVKLVLPEMTLEVCRALQKRGYRLGVVSNAPIALSDVFRAQGILDLFELILTASEVGSAKPKSDIFQAALDDLDVLSSQAMMVGASYAVDIVGAKRTNIRTTLYDPQHREIRALAPEEVGGKVVSMDSLRHNRRLSGVNLIFRFEELLEFCL